MKYKLIVSDPIYFYRKGLGQMKTDSMLRTHTQSYANTVGGRVESSFSGLSNFYKLDEINYVPYEQLNKSNKPK